MCKFDRKGRDLLLGVSCEVEFVRKIMRMLGIGNDYGLGFLL